MKTLLGQGDENGRLVLGVLPAHARVEKTFMSSIDRQFAKVFATSNAALATAGAASSGSGSSGGGTSGGGSSGTGSLQ